MHELSFLFAWHHHLFQLLVETFLLTVPVAQLCVKFRGNVFFCQEE